MLRTLGRTASSDCIQGQFLVQFAPLFTKVVRNNKYFNDHEKQIIAFLVAAGLSFAAVATDYPPEMTNGTVIVLSTNDSHGHIDDGAVRFSQIAALRDELVAAGKQVLLLDGGDYMQGTTAAVYDKGLSLVQIVKATGYDLVSLGNHEFDYTAPYMVETLTSAALPVVCCDLFETNGTTHQVTRPFPDGKIFERGGLKIGVVGVDTPTSIASSLPANFLDPTGTYYQYDFDGRVQPALFYARVQQAVDTLKNSCDTVLIVGHLGTETDCKPFRSEDLVANTTNITAIIDGHSHFTMPGTEMTNAIGKAVRVTQTPGHLKALGWMTLDEKGKVIASGHLTSLWSTNATVYALETNLIDKVQRKFGTVVATAPHDYKSYGPPPELIRVVRGHETNLGDLSADSVYWYVNFSNKTASCDFALVHGGGIRTDIISGEVTLKALNDVMPFANRTVVIKAKGRTILDGLEWGAQASGQGIFGGFIQCAGLKYDIATNLTFTCSAASGSWLGGPTNGVYRVRNVKVYDRDKQEWAPLDLDREYNVAGQSSLLRQACDGAYMWTNSTVVVEDVGQDYEVFGAYCNAFKKGLSGLPELAATNSPLSTLVGYPLDYNTPYGQSRIAWRADDVWYMDYERAKKIPQDDRDGSWDRPFMNFSDAIYVAEKADIHPTVMVESSEPYTLDAMLRMPPKGITFMPMESDGMVTLDAQGKCACVYSDFLSSTFYRFRFINGKDTENGGGVCRATLVDSVISNCTTTASGGGAWDCNLTNCFITCCSAGKNGGAADHSNLFGCLIVSNCAAQAGGATSYSNVGNCTILRNVAYCTDTKYWATNWVGIACYGVNEIRKDGGTNYFMAANCIVLDNVCPARKDHEMYGFKYDHCNFGNHNGDPKFVDAANGDYRLRADSPCIDICNVGVWGEPALDMDGKPRVRGAGVDCGCYEFQRHAAFPPGTLNVSSNAQTIGTVMYAQGGWSIKVDDSAKDWLTADVLHGVETNTLRLTFKENATGFDRAGTISVYTNGSTTAVQTVKIGQVASAAISGYEHRKGLFVGCGEFAIRKETGKCWQNKLDGSANDAKVHRDLWCGTNMVEAGFSIILTNKMVTLEAFSNSVETVLSELTPQDEFMLAIATHGGGADGYWKPSFTIYPVDEHITFEMLSNTLIRASQKCSKVICVLDSCSSAAAYKFADQMLIDAEITDRRSMPKLKLTAASPAAPYAGIQNIAILAAADYDQSSRDAGVNGAFTASILKGVSNELADADGDGYVDLHEIWRYAYYMSKYGYENSYDEDYSIVQPRCYNAPLLLKTRLCRLSKARKPSVDSPLNPYHIDFVNWLDKCARDKKLDVDNPNDVAAASSEVALLTTGGTMSYPDAFVAGYDPIDDTQTIDPLTMFIALTNQTPYITWQPNKPDLIRVYNVRAKKNFTDEWTNLGEKVDPEALKPYNFFSVEVNTTFPTHKTMRLTA